MDREKIAKLIKLLRALPEDRLEGIYMMTKGAILIASKDCLR